MFPPACILCTHDIMDDISVIPFRIYRKLFPRYYIHSDGCAKLKCLQKDE